MIKAELIGNLGKDAEIKTIGGNSYASFSLAVTERIKGENKTTWYRIMKLDKEGKLTAYLNKGMKVWVSGKPFLSAYINKNTGEAIPDMTIWASELEFCSSVEQRQQQTMSQSAPQSGIDNFPSRSDNIPDDLPF